MSLPLEDKQSVQEDTENKENKAATPTKTTYQYSKGETVQVFEPLDGGWYRAKVLEIKDDHLNVQFFGFSKEFPLKVSN